MRRSTDIINYSPINSNFTVSKRYSFKQLLIDAFLKKNVLLSHISFTNYNNTLIVNLHVLYRTKRLLAYRRKLRFKVKLASKRERKIKQILNNYSIRYMKRLNRIKNTKVPLFFESNFALVNLKKKKLKKNNSLKKKIDLKYKNLKKIAINNKIFLLLKLKLNLKKQYLKLKKNNFYLLKNWKKLNKLNKKKKFVKKNKKKLKSRRILKKFIKIKQLLNFNIKNLKFLKKNINYINIILKFYFKKLKVKISRKIKFVKGKNFLDKKIILCNNRKVFKNFNYNKLSFRIIRKIYKKNIKRFYIKQNKKRKNKIQLNKKYLITKFLKNTSYTDLKFRIYPLNYKLKHKDLTYFYKKLRYFQRNIFIRGHYLFIDLLKATTLLLKESISLKTYTFLLGLVLESIHKNKHNMYLRFLKTLLNIIFVYIKRLKKKLFVNSNILGIKIRIHGKLKGKDRTKVERFLKGNLYTSSLSAKLHFARYHAHTKYGVFGLTVWVCYKNFKKTKVIKNSYANQILINNFLMNSILFKKFNKFNQKKLMFSVKKNLKKFYFLFNNSLKKRFNDNLKKKKIKLNKNKIKYINSFINKNKKKLMLKQFIFQTFIRVYIANLTFKNILIKKYIIMLSKSLKTKRTKIFNNNLFKFFLRKKKNKKLLKKKKKLKKQKNIYKKKNKHVKKTNRKKKTTQRT